MYNRFIVVLIGKDTAVEILTAAILPKAYDTVLGIGLDACKGKLKSVKEQVQIREKLEAYLSVELQKNWFCTQEEEIDFEGLANYIRTDLINDVEIRLFGEKEQRAQAREEILRKAAEYAHAHTSLSRERAISIVSNALNVLREFYRTKVPRDYLYIAGEMVDIIGEKQEQETEKLSEKIEYTERVLEKKIGAENLLSTDANIRLMQSGNYTGVEQNITSAIRAISTMHPLHEYYGVGVHTVDGKTELFSCPTSKNIPQEYQPKMQLGVKATLGGRKINGFNSSTLSYAYRHQIPFDVNVIEAKKMLGTVPDPYQHEAERELGKRYKIYPPQFPAASPYSLLGDDNVVIQFLLLRTREISDDGTCEITNEEQKNAPVWIRFKLNDSKKTFQFSIEPLNDKNSEKLVVAKIMKSLTSSEVIRLHSLEYDSDLVTGKVDPDSYHAMFDTFAEDMDFYEKVIDIEQYLEKDIELPPTISQRDVDNIEYLAGLVRGDKCGCSWAEFSSNLIVSQNLKDSVKSKSLDHELCLTESGIVPIELFGSVYKIPITRTFPYVIIKDLERFYEKVQVLDPGDSIKITCVPGHTGNMVWDQLNKASDYNVPADGASTTIATETEL